MEVSIIKQKLLVAVVALLLTCVIVPTNIFVYATSDIEEVEEISATIEIEVIPIEGSVGTTTDKGIDVEIADVLNVDENNLKEKSLIITEETLTNNEAYISTNSDTVVEKQFNDMNKAGVSEILDFTVIDVTSELQEDVTVSDNLITVSDKKIEPAQIVGESLIPQDGVLSIASPDENYNGVVVSLDPDDRELLEHLVMGEAGNQGYEGACLVAQAIRDAMVYKGYSSVSETRKAMAYSGSISLEPNQDVLNAVSYIFDQGGNAVQHKILYFYNPAKCTSDFHESQELVIEYKSHRFFCNK